MSFIMYSDFELTSPSEFPKSPVYLCVVATRTYSPNSKLVNIYISLLRPLLFFH